MSFSYNSYNVPYYIGEFTLFHNAAEWDKWLREYEKRGWNWTVWNYKMSSVGWWDNSWAMYVNRMNLKNERLKLDLRTATYDEIYAEWSAVGTQQRIYKTGMLYNVMKN